MDNDYNYGRLGRRSALKIITTVIIVAFVIFLLSALLGFQIPGLPSYALWHIIELLFVIWIILLVLRWSFFPWHMHRGMRDGNATRILRRRYAKGEISETQYRKMMKTLSEKS